MGKGVKRVSYAAIALILVFALLAFIAYRRLHGVPSWYQPQFGTAQEREIAAQSATNKFARIQNAAAAARAHALAASHPIENAAPITVTFTDSELNAFFEKWSDFENWKDNYDRYLDHPIILLDPGRITLAGHVKEMDTIVSLQLEPHIDSQGRLDTHLSTIAAGNLNVPSALIAPYQNRIIAALNARLPAWRQNAALQRNGGANGSLIAASLARLLIHTLRNEPAEPTLFLPLVERGSNVPVQITDITVQDHALTITVQPMDGPQRSSMLARIRADETPVALAH